MQNPTVCPPCEPNTADTDSDPVTPCRPCPMGWSSSSGATGCSPNPCSNSIPEGSTTICRGATNDTCDYECSAGFAPDGEHKCHPNASFAGGRCAPLPCIGGFRISHSVTDCAGLVTGERCGFSCERGYHPMGEHFCMSFGYIYGGSCDPNPCTRGRTVNLSTTICILR